MMAWILESVIALFDFLLSALLTLPALAIRGILYLIQLGLYELLSTIRDILALHGLTYPTYGLLNTAHGRNLITPYQCGYKPKPHPAIYSPDENSLQCPSSGIEKPKTLPSQYSELSTPQEFIEGTPLDEGALYEYANASAPQETRNLNLSMNGQIGSAVEFATWMIQNWKGDSVATTNWNLDSDRGYAYKQWTGTLPTKPPGHVVKNESYNV